MELPEKIAGLDARKVREMFKAMMATETKIEWNDGAPSIELRRVTPELVETSLDVPKAEALRILADARGEGNAGVSAACVRSARTSLTADRLHDGCGDERLFIVDKLAA
jgi:hypothetical protein